MSERLQIYETLLYPRILIFKKKILRIPTRYSLSIYIKVRVYVMTREHEHPEAQLMCAKAYEVLYSISSLPPSDCLWPLAILPLVICMVALKVSILRWKLKIVYGRKKLRTTHSQQAGTDNTALHLQRGAEGGLR